MGAGASLAQNEPEASSAGGALTDASILAATATIHAAHLHDQYRAAHRKGREVLAKEQEQCSVLGYPSHETHYQPALRRKLEGGLRALDLVAVAHGDDQRRASGGNTTVPLAPLAKHGPVGHLYVLGDTSTIVCASASGPVWTYNWRAGEVISEMRLRGPDGKAVPGQGGQGGAAPNVAGAVRRLSSVSSGSGAALVGTGDEKGYLQFWDLQGPGLRFERHIHQGAIAGLRHDEESHLVYTTASDAHVMVFDVQAQTLVDRAKPASASCGDGVPNTALAVAGGGSRSKLLLVGGEDGKLRVWSRDSGAFRREHTLSCGCAAPSEILLCSDGYRAAVATRPGDPLYLNGEAPAHGGLLLFDLRKLGNRGLGSEASSSAALVAEHRADGSHGCAPRGCAWGAPKGTLDMALTEEHGRATALCAVDGFLRAFDLGNTSGGRLRADDEEFVEEKEEEASLAWRFDADVVARYDVGPQPSPWPCALGMADQFVFAATNAPSLGVWAWSGAARGGEPGARPLRMLSHGVPERLPELPASAERGDQEGMRGAAQLNSVSAVEYALEHDKWRQRYVLGPQQVEP